MRPYGMAAYMYDQQKGSCAMISKKIHYCWYGGAPLPAKARRCMKSWEKYCPDYEIIQWNEQNTEILQIPYLQWCRKHKKYAFLSDYVRLFVIEAYGGIYFDTDVEIIRSFDPLLSWSAFFGFETDHLINTGIGFGAEAHHPLIIQMLDEYQEILQQKPFRVIGCPHLNTGALLKCSLRATGQFQTIGGAAVFPAEYFNPFDPATGHLHLTTKTYSIHWYNASWMSTAKQLRNRVGRPFHRLFGKDCFRKAGD